MESEELRNRFLRAETKLFQLRFDTDDTNEKQAFLRALELDWKLVRPPLPSLSLIK